MGREGITYHDVVHAATQLMARGETPTVERIRRITGTGTGSNTTIAQQLKTWKQQQDSGRLLGANAQIPDELVASIKGLWERVLHEADAKVTVIKEEANQGIAALKEQLKKLQMDDVQAQQENQRLKQETQQLSSDKIALEQAVKQLDETKIVLTPDFRTF